MIDSNRLKTNRNDFILFFKLLGYEIILVLFFAVIVYWLQNETFTHALHRSFLKISLLILAVYGSEVLWTIDQNKWHLRIANEKYPIYPALSLVLINAATGPLMIQSHKRFVVLMIPALVWLITIVESIIKRRWK